MTLMKRKEKVNKNFLKSCLNVYAFENSFIKKYIYRFSTVGRIISSFKFLLKLIFFTTHYYSY